MQKLTLLSDLIEIPLGLTLNRFPYSVTMVQEFAPAGPAFADRWKCQGRAGPGRELGALPERFLDQGNRSHYGVSTSSVGNFRWRLPRAPHP